MRSPSQSGIASTGRAGSRHPPQSRSSPAYSSTENPGRAVRVLAIGSASYAAPVAPDDAPPRRSLAQSVFRDGALYAVAGALGQAIGFILFPFLAHVFEPSDFGVVDLVVVLTTIVNLTVALEVSQGLGRHFAEARTLADKRAYASSAFTFSLLCYTGFCTLVVLFAAPLTDLLLGDDVDPGVMRVAAAAMFFNGLQLHGHGPAALAAAPAGVRAGHGRR